MADENKRLIPITIAHTDDNNWRITVDGEDSYFVKGDIEDIKKVCRRIKAKDGENNNKCRSAKVGTYLSMISNSNNEEHKINVWKSRVPYTAEDFKKLMESKEMKTITLTKNYLIEGKILSKGTVISLKEKLDFLPTDIWEKAKTIEDKHERFEFVKAELNKLGDDYTDNEIENFLSKYETELTESLKEKEVDGIDDMMDMLEETLESEDYVAKENFKKVLDVAKKDEELLDAWEAMATADDKTFVKKENDFWNRFDKICKPFKK